MSGVSEQIDVIAILNGVRSLQGPYTPKFRSHVYSGLILHRISAVSQYAGKSDELITVEVDFPRLHPQICPFPESAIPIGMSTKAGNKSLPELFPCAQLILGIKGYSFAFGTLLTDVRMNAVVPDFGGSLKKGDHQANLIPLIS
jgi:hypothetical protein